MNVCYSQDRIDRVLKPAPKYSKLIFIQIPYGGIGGEAVADIRVQV